MSLWLVECLRMRELFILVAHLLTTLAKLMRPGGVRAAAAESLMLKHQMLILNRSRKRAPQACPVESAAPWARGVSAQPEAHPQDRSRREDQHPAEMASSPNEVEISPSLFASTTESPWPQGAFGRIDCCSAGDQASQSPLRLSADRATDRLHVRGRDQQGRGPAHPRPVLSPRIWQARPFMADRYW